MNVLIVEDDPMVALINKRYLEQITGVKTFGPVMYEKEIISSLEENKIDLILMDVFLPEKSGIDILKVIREKNIFTDVIMITAANSSDEIKKAFAYGVVDYLVKPFEFERFKESINKYKIKNNLLLNDEILTQNDIDNLIMNNSLGNQVKLPKGLNEKTLNRVINLKLERYKE